MTKKPAAAPAAEAETTIGIGWTDRLLTLWVSIAIVVGVTLGHWFPEAFWVIDKLEVGRINIPVAVMLWLMLIPMLLRIDFTALPGLVGHGGATAVTLSVGWLLKPLIMALVTWAFVGHWLTPWFVATEVEGYMAGMIILGVVPCLALIPAWSRMAGAETRFASASSALNALIAPLAFIPLIGLLLWLTGVFGLGRTSVPWAALGISLVLYFIAPLAIAAPLRLLIMSIDPRGGLLKGVLAVLRPLGLLALMLTLIIIFGLESDHVFAAPLTIGLLAVPLLVHVLVLFAIGYLLNRWIESAHGIAAPSALIVSSNFFVLALGTSIVIYGLGSAAALITVVWLLIEVPLMAVLVMMVRGSREWYEGEPEILARVQMPPVAVKKAPSEPGLPLAATSAGKSESSGTLATTQPESLRVQPRQEEKADNASWIPGEVVADRLATLNAPIAGRILACGVRAGDRVAPDQELMRIAFADGAATAALRAPWQSVVRHVHIPVEGCTVETGQPLVELIAADGFMLRFAVPEADAEALRPGDRVTVRFNRRVVQDVELEILRAWPELDPNTRTRSFEAPLPADLNPYVGLGAKVRIAEVPRAKAPPQLARDLDPPPPPPASPD